MENYLRIFQDFFFFQDQNYIFSAIFQELTEQATYNFLEDLSRPYLLKKILSL